VHTQVKNARGSTPAMAELVQFVGEYIEHKDMLRLFDIASVVARRKEGDCTEHAVLLTALARSFGYRARVVLGIVFVPIGSPIAAFEHAWVEYRAGDEWVIADAALPRGMVARYVPLDIIHDEGPAFMRYLSPNGFSVSRAVVDPP
jgi:transglutaminase-like putative cysteine protease